MPSAVGQASNIPITLSVPSRPSIGTACILDIDMKFHVKRKPSCSICGVKKRLFPREAPDLSVPLSTTKNKTKEILVPFVVVIVEVVRGRGGMDFRGGSLASGSATAVQTTTMTTTGGRICHQRSRDISGHDVILDVAAVASGLREFLVGMPCSACGGA